MSLVSRVWLLPIASLSAMAACEPVPPAPGTIAAQMSEIDRMANESIAWGYRLEAARQVTKTGPRTARRMRLVISVGALQGRSLSAATHSRLSTTMIMDR